MRSRAALDHRPFRTPLFAYTPRKPGVRSEARLSSQPCVHVSLLLPLPLPLPQLLLLLLLLLPLPMLLLMLPPPQLLQPLQHHMSMPLQKLNACHMFAHLRSSPGWFRTERQRPLSD